MTPAFSNLVEPGGMRALLQALFVLSLAAALRVLAGGVNPTAA
jgi:hypothetical protein